MDTSKEDLRKRFKVKLVGSDVPEYLWIYETSETSYQAIMRNPVTVKRFRADLSTKTELMKLARHIREFDRFRIKE